METVIQIVNVRDLHELGEDKIKAEEITVEKERATIKER